MLIHEETRELIARTRIKTDYSRRCRETVEIWKSETIETWTWAQETVDKFVNLPLDMELSSVTQL